MAVITSELVNTVNMGKLCTLFAFCFVPAMALAGELIQIGTVLQHPAEYHLRIIRLHGVASDVQRVENTYSYKYGGCAGAYSFTLGDDSGRIAVEVRSICVPSHAAIPQVKDGQIMSIDARIEAPGYYTGQGRPLGELVNSTRAVALKIYPE